MIIDAHAQRQCNGCEHWQIDSKRTAKDGYAIAQCRRPFKQVKIEFEWPITRASDTCSGWIVRKPPPDPVAADPWGYGYG